MASPFLMSVPSLADAKRQSLVDQSLNSARKVLSGKDYPDALRNMGKARGVIIVPELVQGGFIFGAAGGRGILVARTGPNHWSYPAFYGMGSGSIGLQVGGKVSEIVFIILTEKGLAAILDHKFKFGAEAGVTMVAVGIGLEGASTAATGRRHRGLCQLQRPVRRRLARRLVHRRRQRLECALLRAGRDRPGDRAGRTLLQSRRRAAQGIPRPVVS